MTPLINASQLTVLLAHAGAQTVELDLMTVDEAIDAMEAVGHDFFLFRQVVASWA